MTSFAQAADLHFYGILKLNIGSVALPLSGILVLTPKITMNDPHLQFITNFSRRLCHVTAA